MSLMQRFNDLCSRYATKKRGLLPSEVRSALWEAVRLGIECVRAELPIALEGCGDGSCVVAKPKGMHTNGGCCCDERRLRRAVQAWRQEADRLSALLLKERESKEVRP